MSFVCEQKYGNSKWQEQTSMHTHKDRQKSSTCESITEQPFPSLAFNATFALNTSALLCSKLHNNKKMLCNIVWKKRYQDCIFISTSGVNSLYKQNKIRQLLLLFACIICINDHKLCFDNSEFQFLVLLFNRQIAPLLPAMRKPILTPFSDQRSRFHSLWLLFLFFAATVAHLLFWLLCRCSRCFDVLVVAVHSLFLGALGGAYAT